MAYMTAPYRDANSIQKLLIDKMKQEEEGGISLAALCRAWIETEYLKREMRGLAKLKAHSMREILEAKRLESKTIDIPNEEPAELEEITTIPEPKESLIPETVPTTPDRTPP